MDPDHQIEGTANVPSATITAEPPTRTATTLTIKVTLDVQAAGAPHLDALITTQRSVSFPGGRVAAR